MKRSTRLFIGFVAAALTYSSLMAFAGPQYKNRHGFYFHQAHSKYHRQHCGDRSSWNRDHSHANPEQENPPVDLPRNNQ